MERRALIEGTNWIKETSVADPIKHFLFAYT